MRYIIKRDGRKQEYNFDKIRNAVEKAFKSCKQDTPEKFLEQLEEEFNKVPEDVELNIDEIQDTIQRFLMKKNKYCVAESFIKYRDKRDRERQQKSKLMKGIREKLEARNVQNQNANLDERSFGGRMGEATRVITKEIALDDCMSEMARNNHLNNEVYIHDLDNYVVGTHNCLTIPFDDLLANGFNTRQTDVRPAKSVNTAFQLIAVIFQLQSLQQFGGVSASHIDWTMVPYVKKSFRKHIRAWFKDVEGMTKEDAELETQALEHLYGELCFTNEAFKENYPKIYRYAYGQTESETYQAVEGMYHNLNTLQSRSGNQLPFTSINYGTCTEPEGRMVTKAILDVSIAGLGKYGKTSIFPCGIFQCMKGVNRKPGEPNYDLFRLALESTAKRLYPNYVNVDWSVNAGYDKNDPTTYCSTMGCRTYNGFDINGMGQKKDGRGNLCPVTIILPTIAMEAKGKCAEETGGMYNDEMLFRYFMTHLDTKIEEAKDMLIERFNWICKQPMESAKFMYENHVMAGYVPEEGIVSALKHGTLTIGQIGLAETLQALFGCDHTDPKGMEYAKRIEQLFNDRCKEYKQKYKLNFGVYYTPAENLCYTAMKKFRAKYGVIENVSDRDYFTNSTHVPVWHEMDPFKKIDIEAELACYSNAGCITYIELPSTCHNNLEALEEFVNYAMDKDLPYFAVNTPNDFCEVCGYQGEIGETCPKCGASGKSIKRLRRVTGYLTGSYLEAFNDGKIKETKDRVKHTKN